MGEETDNPGRNIPRALAGTLLLTGVLFVVVMFAQVNGFGTDQAGLDAFQSSGNTLGDFGSTFVGQWFGLVVIFTAIVSAFGCHLATSATSGRMLYAFARDGFGPKTLAHIHAATGGPRRATWLVVIVAVVVNLICGAVGWPEMGTGNDAIDTYFLFAIAGSVCLMALPAGRDRSGLVRRCTEVPRRARRQGQGPRTGATSAGRAGDRGGAVVQRQGRRNMVRSIAIGSVLVPARFDYRHRRLGHRKRVGESLSTELNLTRPGGQPGEHPVRARRGRHCRHRETPVLPAGSRIRTRLYPRRAGWPRAAGPVGDVDGVRARSRSPRRCRRRRRAVRNAPGAGGLSAVHPDSVGLAEDLLALVPGTGERRVYLGHAGSDANDVALRACRHATGKRTVVAFEHSYHGGVGVAMGVSGVHVDAGAAPDADAVFLPYPNPFRPASGDIDTDVAQSLELAETHLATGSIACLIVEPILSAAGWWCRQTAFWRNCTTYAVATAYR